MLHLWVIFLLHLYVILLRLCELLNLETLITLVGPTNAPFQPFPGNEGMPFFSNNFWLFTLEMIVWVFTGSVLTQNIKKSEKKIWRGPVPLFSRKLRKTIFSKFFGFFDQN